MNFLKRLLGGGEPRDPNALWLYVRCGYCGQKLKIRVDRRFDLSHDHDQGGYILHKEILDGTCFQRMHAVVRYDPAYRIVSQEVEGGELLTKEEFEVEENKSEG